MNSMEYYDSIARKCSFQDYEFEISEDGRGAWYLQAHYMEEDITSKALKKQSTRRWFISPEMTKSEFVQTIFKCCLTSMEHRTRERFTYRDKRVFGPHFDVEALHSICGQLDYRT